MPLVTLKNVRGIPKLCMQNYYWNILGEFEKADKKMASNE